MVRGIISALGVSAVLVCAGVAGADVTFTPVWEKLGNTDVNSPRVMAWDPVTNTMILPESAGSYLVHAYDGASGATKANLSTAGLSLGGLGHFAMAGSASGKIYGYNDNIGGLSVWNSLSDPTPHAETWAGGFARNLFVSGSTIYAVGTGDGGPITINNPDPTAPGTAYVLTESVGGRSTTGFSGGKAGVAANAAGTILYGTETISGPPDDGIHMWKKDAGTWTYQGDLVFPDNFPITGGVPNSVDVALDEAHNLLFGIDRNNDKIFAIDLGVPDTFGDETYVGEYTVASDTMYYGSLAVDPAGKHLYWMARNTDLSASFGVLSYTVPGPTHFPGDTNNDGVVDLTDLNNVLNNFGSAGSGNPGDDNSDNIVDLTDLNNVLNNFGSTHPVGALGVVPEPGSLGLIGVAAAGLLRRRRRAV